MQFISPDAQEFGIVTKLLSSYIIDGNEKEKGYIDGENIYATTEYQYCTDGSSESNRNQKSTPHDVRA